MEHAIGMKKLGIEFDILAYNTLKKTWVLSNENLSKFEKAKPEVDIILKKARNIYYPFSFIYNFILLLAFFIKNKKKYSFIHARADYTAFLCILTKPFHNLPVYWDCRGDSMSELKDNLSRKNILIRLVGKFYFVVFLRIVVYVNCKKSDGAIFVSRALYNLFAAKLKTNDFQIIPCPVSEAKFFFDSELRFKMRNELNISAEKKVYLYSGSMIAYQSLKEQYEQYDLLLKDLNNIIIIATSDPDIAKVYFKKLISERFIITSVSFEQMNSYYNLADFAFLLRENKQLNFVASPTKFGEYCLTGIPVIMNDTVNQAYEIAGNLGNYVSYEDAINIPLTIDERKTIAIKARDFYSREVLNLKYLELYKRNIL